MADKVLILSARDIATLTNKLKAEDVIRMLGRTMSALTRSAGRAAQPGEADPIQNPLRIATTSEKYTTLYMPGRLTTTEGSGTAIKVVAVPGPEATLPGLPATTLVFDEETGKCEAVVNASELTGLRTAAASALAATILASPASVSLVVFGTGTQSYYHARLILDLFPSISTVTFVARSRTGRAAELLTRVQSEYPSIKSSLATPEQTSSVVQTADIICGCVPSTAPVFAAKDLKPGVAITAIGSYKPHMQEFPPELIAPNGTETPIPRILVDSREAVMAEAGEVIASGIAASDIVELGDVFDGDGQPKRGAVEREGLKKNGMGLFKCVGCSSMDIGVTKLMVKLAKESGVGTYVDF